VEERQENAKLVGWEMWGWTGGSGIRCGNGKRWGGFEGRERMEYAHTHTHIYISVHTSINDSTRQIKLFPYKVEVDDVRWC